MVRNKVQVLYILSLLVLASLLILFAQGVFSGLSGSLAEPTVEITRIDLMDDFLGNYSKISVKLANNDTIKHNFSINTFFDEELKGSLNISVNSGNTFMYQRGVLPERIPISQNETINSNLRVARFVVYMNEQPEPIEETSFVFNNH